MPTITMYVPQSKEQSLTSQNRWFYSAERAGKKANIILLQKSFLCLQISTDTKRNCVQEGKKYISKAQH